MIRVILTRDELVARGACAAGLAVYDAIVELSVAGGIDVEWTPLAAVWLAGRCPEYSRWLADEGLIPIAPLRDADLRGADLRGANLRGADLRRADLLNADLSGANLSGANLRNADLLNADLSGANLLNANLSGANLRGADLRRADLLYADLSGADLSGAQTYDAPDGWRVVNGLLVRRREK